MEAPRRDVTAPLIPLMVANLNSRLGNSCHPSDFYNLATMFADTLAELFKTRLPVPVISK